MKRQNYPSCGYRECPYYKRWKQNKKPLNKADKYLLLSIITLLIFTAIVIIMNAFSTNIQEQLIVGTYAFFGTEIGACCIIKVINIKNEVQAPQDYYDDAIDDGSD